MTDEERDQVVELLRCAADCERFALGNVFAWIYGPRVRGQVLWVWEYAVKANGAAGFDLLEAAARVEEGSYP